LTLRACHFIASGVLLALLAFGLGNQASTPRLQRREMFQIGIRIQATISIRRADIIEAIAYEGRVNHRLPS
jgi:hypothetical protein